MKKILILIILLLINIVSAQPSTYILDDTLNEDSFKIENNIYTNIKTYDSDGIIQYEAWLEPPDNSTGLDINISNGVNIKVLIEKQYYTIFGLNTGIPYLLITEFGTFKNYTVFYKNMTNQDLISGKIYIKGFYDIDNGNSSFSVSQNLKFIDFETDKYLGLPSSNIIFTGLSSFELKIKYIDLSNKITNERRIQSLNPISKFLYDIFNLLTLYKASDTILNIISIFDYIIYFFTILFNILFIYPYIIILYIITIGNFIAGYKSNNWKEFLLNLMEYYKYIGNIFVNIVYYVYDMIIRIIQLIRG